MRRINLETVTLVCVSGIKPVKSLISIVKALSKAKFSEVVFVTTKIPSLRLGCLRVEAPYEGNLDTIDAYNYYIIYLLYRHVRTNHCLVIQYDSGIVNRKIWNPEFLEYDYIGAPWPLSNSAYIDPFGNHQRVGNGGFSLRSRHLLMVPTFTNIEWEVDQGSYYKHFNLGFKSEDGNICVHNKSVYESAGCKFAPLEVAVRFSRELDIPENFGIESFGYHKYYPNSRLKRFLAIVRTK